MGSVFAVVNQKGGVGKTTTAVNVAACLAASGERTLLVDTDPQGNATSGVGVVKSELEACIYDVLINEVPIERVIVPTETAALDLVPAKLDLAGADIELMSSMSRETKLKQALERVADRYEFMIIDCPPSLGLLTLGALCAADGVLIPLQCEYYALEGLSSLLNTVELIQKRLNPQLTLQGILLTMYDRRNSISTQVADEVRSYFEGKVFETVIPRNVRLSEAPSFGKPIILYDIRSPGSQSYLALAQELLGILDLARGVSCEELVHDANRQQA